MRGEESESRMGERRAGKRRGKQIGGEESKEEECRVRGEAGFL